MSVTNTTRLDMDSGGGHSVDGSRIYDSTYEATTDDVQDGPQTVIDGAAIPAMGATYAAGNDTDSRSILTSITPRRVVGTRERWHINCHYEPRGEQRTFRDINLRVTTDPVLAVPTVQVFTVTRQQAVQQAILRTALPDRQVGEYYPISNSAGDILSPKPTRDFPITAIRIRRNLLNFFNAPQLVGTVNNNIFTLNHPGLSEIVLGTQAQLTQFGGSQRIVNDQLYWEIECEIHINPYGWRLVLIDAGTTVIAKSGDSNGEGGTFSSADLPGGQPALRQLLGTNGQPIVQPRRLDGRGGLLKDSELPFFIEWSIYEEINFGVLNFMWDAN